MNKFKIPVLAVLVSLAVIACKQDHVKELDGKTTRAVFSKNSSKNIILRDEQGDEFYVNSPNVDVEVEANLLSASKIFVRNEGHTAVFEVPRSLVSQGESVVSISAEVSKQPVDLRVKESVIITSKWLRHRFVTGPIYSTHQDGDGNKYKIRIGYSKKYFRVHMAMVQYNVLIDVFTPGAIASGFPETQKQCALKMVVFTQKEVLRSEPISAYEYNHEGQKKAFTEE